MSRRNKNVGDWGEEQACLFLQRQGFVIIERNYHTTTGEIDIVAKKGDDFYFVEVKTRAAGALATDLAVTEVKKLKMNKAVRHYCYKRGVGDVGIVLSSLVVTYDRINKKVSFRLVFFSLKD